jgi:hypothetical protein
MQGDVAGAVMACSMRQCYLLAGILAFVSISCDRRSDEVINAQYGYSPAFLDRQLRQLHIFRLHGNETTQRAPAFLGEFAYGPDGKSIYGFSRDQPGLLKFDIRTMQLGVVPESLNLRGARGIAVSSDEQRIILSGTYGSRDSQICGLFEFRPSDGGLTMLVENKDCGPQMGLAAVSSSAWTDLSLSADGERILARNKAGLSIIDLVKRRVEPLGAEYGSGTWSPDGRWLAAVETAGEQKTVLLDATTLRPERTLGTSLTRWSPDSRYLLAVARDLCGPYWSTLAVIDVETGIRLTVRSSKCSVNLNSMGWVKIQGL